MDFVAWFEIIVFPIEEEAAGSTMDLDIRKYVDTRKYVVEGGTRRCHLWKMNPKAAKCPLNQCQRISLWVAIIY